MTIQEPEPPRGGASNLTRTLTAQEVENLLWGAEPESLDAIGPIQGLIHEVKHVTLPNGTRMILYLCENDEVWAYWTKEGFQVGRYRVLKPSAL